MCHRENEHNILGLFGAFSKATCPKYLYDPAHSPTAGQGIRAIIMERWS